MKRAVKYLVLLPFAAALIAVWPLLKAVDWAAGEKVIGSLRDELADWRPR